MKICFLAPSGYGKSTAIEILKKYYNITNIKIAQPLYKLQDDFYKTIGIDIGNKQDGELLQFYGCKIRKENPMYLINTFFKEVEKHDGIITNDDCRPYDYQYLKDNGFIFIKINGYSHDRSDHTKADSKLNLEWQNNIPYDYEVINNNTLDKYEEELLRVMEVLNEREMLYHSSSKRM